jgi:hypothetical protein
MSKVTTLLMAAAVAAFIGCGNTSSTGGPGATATRRPTAEPTHATAPPAGDRGGRDAGNPDAGAADKGAHDTFELTGDKSVNVKQDAVEHLKLGIKRGDAFKQDVKLSFESEPPDKGLMVDPNPATFSKGDKEAVVNLKATADAALGKHTLVVKGTPESGKPVELRIEVDVKKK